MENKTTMWVSIIIFVYTLLWWYIAGIFGLIAVFGFTKIARQKLLAGETDVWNITIHSFIDSRWYWISAFLVPFVIGLLVGLGLLAAL